MAVVASVCIYTYSFVEYVNNMRINSVGQSHWLVHELFQNSLPGMTTTTMMHCVKTLDYGKDLLWLFSALLKLWVGPLPFWSVGIHHYNVHRLISVEVSLVWVGRMNHLYGPNFILASKNSLHEMRDPTLRDGPISRIYKPSTNHLIFKMLRGGETAMITTTITFTKILFMTSSFVIMVILLLLLLNH